MRKRTGLFEELLEVGRRLPWGVTAGLAIVTFVGFHYLAGLTPPAPDGVSTLGLFAGRQFIKTIATFLQYLIPVGLIIGAGASLIQRRSGSRHLAETSADPIRSIHSMSWRDFERLIGAYFERDGFAVEHTGGGGADGGVDLALTKGRELTLVQCKRWRAQKVGVATVRELYGVMAARAAAHGIVVTVGEFTPDACEFAAGRNIDLLNGRTLARILQDRNGTSPVIPLPDSPPCPGCGSKMVKRVARKGPSAGQPFWGCGSYPRCRAIVPIQQHRLD